MKFDPLKDDFSLPKAEEKVLAFWETHDIFHKSLQQAKDRPRFVFYEGPPTANGRPGIHHVIARTVKDLFCRYKAMNGFRVERKGGWDTHGLPVEIEVEKQLKLDSKAKIVEYGVDKFNQKCRESVFKYLEDWNYITRRTGYWLDLKDAYVTLTNDYIESVWSILKNFHDRDLLYKGHKVIPYCPRCGTGLSSHEVAQGYQTVKDPSVFVKFKAADGDFSYLVWTTTPWTLPSNAALCLLADADYVTVEHEGEKLVLAEALVPKLFEQPPVVVAKNKGSAFVGRAYTPLFDFYANQAGKAFKVVSGAFVTLEDGTGIVHIAPGFGADDYEIGKQYNLPVLQAIEPNGRFKSLAGKFTGMFVKEADPEIIKDLKIAGRLFKREQYEHNYPFCWRCDTPLIYMARESWFLKTTSFRDRLIANSNAINWVPDEIRSGRMQNWLENNVDWALSRERFWGTPLPIWICSCGKQRAVGSVEQLRADGIDVPIDLDLHKPHIDAIKLRCDCGGQMERVPELIDVWFDSGAMPYAQWHYPFENKDVFEASFPADFISEAIDQTRGWFYSLLAISTMLYDKPAFKNVVVLEFILDKEGKKMSKHKGNVVDPFTTVEKYGADAVRWYLLSVSSPSTPTRFDLDGLGDTMRKYFDTLRNTYSFFAIYANIDLIRSRAQQSALPVEQFLATKAGPMERFDRWIVSRFNSLVKDARSDFDKYEITRPVRAIQYFVIEDLSNWYVRNNRRRFWAADDDPSKMRAYHTLFTMLEGIARLSAPVAPFLAETIWQELVGRPHEATGAATHTDHTRTSVHLQSYPAFDSASIDPELEATMSLVQRIVSLGRAARARKNLKVRQPLARLLVHLEKSSLDALTPDLAIIQDELNIKSVESGDVDSLVTFSAKLNFKVAGARLGKHAKAAGSYLPTLTNTQVKRLMSTGSIQFESDGETVTILLAEAEIIRNEQFGFAVEYESGVTVALDTTLTSDLIDEGFARELVNKIQNMRKTAGFDVSDQIRLRLSAESPVKSAAQRHRDFIAHETLAAQFDIDEIGAVPDGTDWDINGQKATIAVAKVGQ